jgi:hypothetical protein
MLPIIGNIAIESLRSAIADAHSDKSRPSARGAAVRPAQEVEFDDGDVHAHRDESNEPSSRPKG